MNIQELLKAADGANITLSVTPADLKEFALTIIEETKKMTTEDNVSEDYITLDEVMKIFRVSRNTLWRWNRDKYLCNVKLGRRIFYRKSDVNKLMENRNYITHG